MKCATCDSEITNVRLSAAGQDFCSDVCHLRFWKYEMPNLGGRWITDKTIARIESLEGEARKEECGRINRFIMNNMDDTVFFQRLKNATRAEDKQE